MLKCLEAWRKYCVGGTSKDFENKWDKNLREMEYRCWDILL